MAGKSVEIQSLLNKLEQTNLIVPDIITFVITDISDPMRIDRPTNHIPNFNSRPTNRSHREQNTIVKTATKHIPLIRR